jgi:leader peptidase (prepilin peptidase)/N-methyltransferase
MGWFDSLDVNSLQSLALVYWVALAFILGAAVGSFVNVAVARLPFEKSLVWPGSRCGLCQQPIRWYDNLPLISYVWLGGQCRACGGRFSSRYFWVELLTALGFTGLFWLEIVRNVHGWDGRFLAMPPAPWLVGFAFHAVLFTLLLTASICDLRTHEIPLGLTLTGTVIGLIGAAVLAWPWPARAPLPPAMPVAWQRADQLIPHGIYAWPFWGPLPAAFAPGGNWQTGLATGVAGALAGTFLMRGVGFLFGTGLGKEAMGLGDADLMMMAGAFVGWQAVVIGFFLSIFPALLLGVLRLAWRGDNRLAFGPPLSIGIMGACLGWLLIGEHPYVRGVMFNGTFMLLLTGALAGMLLVLAFLMRVIKA